MGAILISGVIILRWVDIMGEQVKKVVGHTAPPEFITQVTAMAQSHDTRILVDCIRAYHFGARYNVEIEIVLPGEMTVALSHDIALALQHKIERLAEVERAFVHVCNSPAVMFLLCLMELCIDVNVGGSPDKRWFRA